MKVCEKIAEKTSVKLFEIWIFFKVLLVFLVYCAKTAFFENLLHSRNRIMLDHKNKNVELQQIPNFIKIDWRRIVKIIDPKDSSFEEFSTKMKLIYSWICIHDIFLKLLYRGPWLIFMERLSSFKFLLAHLLFNKTKN